MNPFECATGAYTDRKVVQYFATVQKKDVNTRNRALEKVLANIGELDAESLEQCLYDAMPVLCQEAQESTLSLVSQILGQLLERGSFGRVEERMHLWMGSFLERQDLTGRQLVSRLAKTKRLSGILGRLSQVSSGIAWLRGKIVEAHYLRVPDLPKAKLLEINTQKEQELSLLSSLLQKIKEKHTLPASLQEHIEECVVRRLDQTKSQQKWALCAVLGTSYALDALEREAGDVDSKTFTALVTSPQFQKLVEETYQGGVQEGTNMFVRACTAIPVEGFQALGGLADRKVLLQKVLESNGLEQVAAFEVDLTESEVGRFNETVGPTKINALLQNRHQHLNPNAPALYAGLSIADRVRRADVIGGKMEEVDKELVERLTVEEVREKKIFSEAVRTFGKRFFSEEEMFSDEENLYIATHHPSLCTEHTIDLMFKHGLFPEEILSGMGEHLQGHFIAHLKSTPHETVKELYEAVKNSIGAESEALILSLLYRDPAFKNTAFKEPLAIKSIGSLPKEYILFLSERNGLRPESILQQIVEAGNEACVGALDLADDYLYLSAFFKQEAVGQTAQPMLFGETYTQWEGILAHLGRKEGCKVSLLTQALKTTHSIRGPEFPAGCARSGCVCTNSQQEVFGGEGLVQEIVRGIRFHQDAKASPAINRPLFSSGAYAEIERAFKEVVLESSRGASPSASQDSARYGFLHRLNIVSLVSEAPAEDKDLLIYALARILTATRQHTTATNQHTPLYNAILAVLPQASKRTVSFCLAQITEGTPCIYTLNYSDLSTQALHRLERFLVSSVERASLAIKTDKAWGGAMPSYRYAAYLPVLKAFGKHYASAVLNLYSIAKAEKDAIDAEIFYMMFDIPALGNVEDMEVFEWRLFLCICKEVRSIEICALISAMVRATCAWLSFLIGCEKNSLEMLGLFAQSFPGLAGIFYKSCQSRARIQKYFATTITGPLIREEAARPLQGVDMKVKSIAETHVIVATYKIEDSTLEVNAVFPKDYPLSAPTVSIVKCVGVKKQRLQRLMLRIQVLLSEFCRIGEAMALWKLALDESVNGVEECGICFFMIDEVTKFFPDAECPHCSNKFHKSCLLKWLQKSRGLCPVCREEIGSGGK
ncbi:hypothetical protein NEDG_00149 [Nematocida displodere]|uniref:E3 ubiquitin-protein ligase listerin n=1 Tax=Nematocida displodere TaxID=1805483 RepID=A0A177EI68_9MICR|nr:hypothetical protein NEDG_00149 [Nematocida displodere]